MMETLRNWMSVISVALLAVGYAASQSAFLSGAAGSFAERMAHPSVSTLALAILGLAAAAAAVPSAEGDGR